MMPLAGEYYWVKFAPDRPWEPALYDTMGYWEAIGYGCTIEHDADVTVGQHIQKPEK